MTRKQAQLLVTALEEHVANLITLETAEMGSHDLGRALQESQEDLIVELMDIQALDNVPR